MLWEQRVPSFNDEHAARRAGLIAVVIAFFISAPLLHVALTNQLIAAACAVGIALIAGIVTNELVRYWRAR